MFAWECIQADGKRLGTCADGFLFGSCCGLPPSREAETISYGGGYLFPRNEPLVPSTPALIPTRSPNTRPSSPAPYIYDRINTHSIKLNRSSPFSDNIAANSLQEKVTPSQSDAHLIKKILEVKVTVNKSEGIEDKKFHNVTRESNNGGIKLTTSASLETSKYDCNGKHANFSLHQIFS